MLVAIVLFFGFSSQAMNGKSVSTLPKRISGSYVDLGKVHTVHMVPGFATAIELPTPITGVRIGNPDVVKYVQPDGSPNEVVLILTKPNTDHMTSTTNIIIRSNQKRYVFDIIPNKGIHQDIIDIQGSYGSPSLETEKLKVIDSSQGAK
jgi:hypothetical protein